MPLAQAGPTTVEGFLAGERWQGFRCGFNGIRPIATNGRTAAHGAIAVHRRPSVDDLPQQPLRPHSSDLKVDESDATPSIRRHVSRGQTTVKATILSHEAAWACEQVSSREAALRLTEVNVAIARLEVYRNIVLDD
jgi:hypothetical protein